jgi:hypothetical protein
LYPSSRTTSKPGRTWNPKIRAWVVSEEIAYAVALLAHAGVTIPAGVLSHPVLGSAGRVVKLVNVDSEFGFQLDACGYDYHMSQVVFKLAPSARRLVGGRWVIAFHAIREFLQVVKYEFSGAVIPPELSSVASKAREDYDMAQLAKKIEHIKKAREDFLMAQLAKKLEHVKREPSFSSPPTHQPPDYNLAPTNVPATPQLFVSPSTASNVTQPTEQPTPPPAARTVPLSTTQFVSPPTASTTYKPPEPSVFRSTPAYRPPAVSAPRVRFKQHKRKKARSTPDLFSGGSIVDAHGIRWFRCFGDFECRCRRGWKSAYTWVRRLRKHRLLYKPQRCQRCAKNLSPLSAAPLAHSDEDVEREQPHDAGRCGMCKSLGYDCVNAPLMYS